MRRLTFIFLIFFAVCGYAQAPLKYYIDETSWTYTVITPPGRSKGLIVFIPAFSQSSSTLLDQVDFQNIAYTYGMSTLVIPCGTKVFADKEATKMITKAITKVMHDHDIPKNKVVIGGFSIGGTIALRYAEYCLTYSNDYPAIPQAVFLVDSPTDLNSLYAYCEREIAKNFSTQGVTEAKFIKSILDRDLGGSPPDAPENYQLYSPFNSSLEHGGNLGILQNIAIRSYHDADILWQLKNRQRSFKDMHVVDASEMINQLMLIGNKKAELIIKTGEGVKENGERHPHSMSIVNDRELMIWILNQLNIPVSADLLNIGSK